MVVFYVPCILFSTLWKSGVSETMVIVKVKMKKVFRNDTTGNIRKYHTGGFRQSGGGVEENRLKRCLKGGGVETVTLGGGGGFVLV
jgi:hypothetical protein